MKVVSGLCLFIVTLAYTSAQFPQPPADGTCEPGKSYKVDCNTCLCSPKGTLGACTQIACPPPSPPRYKRQANADLPPVPADWTCTPGRMYKDHCNICLCGRNGKIAGCTYNACRSKRSAEPQECSEGQTKLESCNTCHCSNGRWGCTKKFCSEQNRKRRSPQECSVGQTKQEACNTCQCTNGVWSCSRKICAGQNRKRRAPQECSVGQTKQEACNTCQCTNGVWSCSRKICAGQIRKRRDTEECKVGDFKKDDCNTCNCIQLGDGTKDWACTKLACPRAPAHITRRAAEVCTIGDNKQEDCNNCKCIKAGDGSTGWACTKMICPLRTRRDVGVSPDLKNTPCAPNDFFQLDCNTCYCNSAKTGYLCTENICPPDNTTETSPSNSEGVESTTLINNITITTTGSPESDIIKCITVTPIRNATSTVAPLTNNSTEIQNTDSVDTVG